MIRRKGNFKKELKYNLKDITVDLRDSPRASFIVFSKELGNYTLIRHHGPRIQICSNIQPDCSAWNFESVEYVELSKLFMRLIELEETLKFDTMFNMWNQSMPEFYASKLQLDYNQGQHA